MIYQKSLLGALLQSHTGPEKGVKKAHRGTLNMFSRMLSFVLIVLSPLATFAQVSDKAANSDQMPSNCPGGSCRNVNNVAAATAPNSLPSTRVQGKWEVLDFKATDASVSCSVVKYDATVPLPILHLLCPGKDVYAPLRVHLTLSWKDVAQIPAEMRNMVVDMNSVVKFKSSKEGDSKAELTLQDPHVARLSRQWITFTQVNVGLVLPNK